MSKTAPRDLLPSLALGELAGLLKLAESLGKRAASVYHETRDLRLAAKRCVEEVKRFAPEDEEAAARVDLVVRSIERELGMAANL